MPQNPGRYRHFVTLAAPMNSSAPTPLDPARVKVRILSSGPSAQDERRRELRLEMRYHAGVTLETTIDYDGRTFSVIGINHVNDDRRDLELLCHEVLTP